MYESLSLGTQKVSVVRIKRVNFRENNQLFAGTNEIVRNTRVSVERASTIIPLALKKHAKFSCDRYICQELLLAASYESNW